MKPIDWFLLGMGTALLVVVLVLWFQLRRENRRYKTEFNKLTEGLLEHEKKAIEKFIETHPIVRIKKIIPKPKAQA